MWGLLIFIWSLCDPIKTYLWESYQGQMNKITISWGPPRITVDITAGWINTELVQESTEHGPIDFWHLSTSAADCSVWITYQTSVKSTELLAMANEFHWELSLRYFPQQTVREWWCPLSFLNSTSHFVEWIDYGDSSIASDGHRLSCKTPKKTSHSADEDLHPHKLSRFPSMYSSPLSFGMCCHTALLVHHFLFIANQHSNWSISPAFLYIVPLMTFSVVLN